MRRQKRREPYVIEIENLSHEGRGVGRLNGKTVFVSGALPRETVKARTTKRRGSFDEAIDFGAGQEEAFLGEFDGCSPTVSRNCKGLGGFQTLR